MLITIQLQKWCTKKCQEAAREAHKRKHGDDKDFDPLATFDAVVPDFNGSFNTEVIKDFMSVYKYSTEKKLYDKVLKHYKDVARAKFKAASKGKITKALQDDYLAACTDDEANVHRQTLKDEGRDAADDLVREFFDM